MPTPVQVNDLTVAASSGARFVRGESCRLIAFTAYNPGTGATYIQCFDSLAPPIVGTTVPKWSPAVPAASTVTFPETDVYFRDGLWVAAATTDDGATPAGTANNVSLVLS